MSEKDDDSKETTASSTHPAARRSPGRQLLVFCDGHAVEHPLPKEGVVIIGRGGPKVEVDIAVDHNTLSRRHAKLTIGAHVVIEDCGSRNGTLVNGHALRPNERVIVAPGSPLEVGHALLIIRSERDSKSHVAVAADAAGDEDESVDVLASTDGSLEGRGALERSVLRIAQSRVPVLLLGEPGSGKEHLALHIAKVGAAGSASDRRVVIARCATVASGAELSSLVASARSGGGATLILDEPAALTLDLQETLVALLDHANAHDNRDASLRIVTTSRADLSSPRTLSRSLLDRINGVTLIVPPLRARLRELPHIVHSLLHAIAIEQEGPPPLVSADALAAMSRLAWPGNVRELRTALLRAMTLGSSTPRVLTASHFEAGAGAGAPNAAQALGAGVGTLSSAVSEAEHRRIMEALRQCSGNQTRAAKLLGISRGTLVSRLERYRVPRPRK